MAFLFNRLVEIPIILVLWMFSKVSPRIEGEFARILSKKWRFQLLPKEASLSTQALNYKHEKTLAVNVTVNTQTTVLDFATISEITRNFPFCSVAECGCRSVVGHYDAPRHTCLVLRWAADSTHSIQNRAQYQLPTRAELEKILGQADKWALVNMALSYPDDAHTYAVCSCCDCCCVAFREFRANAVPFMVGSRFVAQIDPDKCQGCFHCVNFRCRFRAIDKVAEDGTLVDPRREDHEQYPLTSTQWSERRNGWGRQIRQDPPSWEKVKEAHSGQWHARVDPNRCFGCGNCASPKYGCPFHAIQLYPREGTN